MNLIGVIDTQVLAAGLLTTKGDAATARVVDGMLKPAFAFAVSVPLLCEYREVLNRPALRAHHGLDRPAVETLLTAMARHAVVLNPKPAADVPAADQHLWDLLGAHAGLCLVTTDEDLLAQRTEPAAVWSPQEFLDLVAAG